MRLYKTTGHLIDKALEAEGISSDEVVEVLVNETEIPLKLRRQIWTLMSTVTSFSENAINHAMREFVNSKDSSDLTARWSKLVSEYWPQFPDCPLKAELDALV